MSIRRQAIYLQKKENLHSRKSIQSTGKDKNSNSFSLYKKASYYLYQSKGQIVLLLAKPKDYLSKNSILKQMSKQTI